jgi:hypothetical protein
MPGRPPTCRLRIGSQLSPDSIHEDLDWAREAVGPFAWRSKVIVDRSEPVPAGYRGISDGARERFCPRPATRSVQLWSHEWPESARLAHSRPSWRRSADQPTPGVQARRRERVKVPLSCHSGDPDQKTAGFLPPGGPSQQHWNFAERSRRASRQPNSAVLGMIGTGGRLSASANKSGLGETPLKLQVATSEPPTHMQLPG